MAIDPSIITSGNQMAQIRLPDVNAMMQTRTAGLENMYNIEQQRAAQAQAEQKEQAVAQEAATLKALLPAYTYGIQTGDIAGAGNLVPPEMRPQIQQYIDALTGKSPEEVKSALIGSLSSSQSGQEALKAIQQAETIGVQRGQLGVSQQRLAFDQSQANQPAAGDFATIETDKGIFVINKKTGEIRPATAGETPAAGEGPIDVGQPPQVLQSAAKAKETAEEVKKRLSDEKRVKDLGLAVSEIERAMTPGGLIDSATGGYLSNLYSTAAAVFSMGTDSSAALARLAPIADLALKMVPRFEGPQSNYDVQSYRDAAGNLANPNVPASTKRAAAEEIVRLFKKYKDQFEYAGDGAGGAGGGVIDFNELGD
jgi:hypothetical protein